MSNTYQLIVDAVYKGGGAFQQARGDLSGLDNAAKGAGAGLSSSLGKIGIAAGAVSLAVGGIAIATKRGYDALREGAALVTTQERFDKLSASIGTTAGALLGDLRAATRGMISDMDLMSSASGIISLRLADNAEQVTRLATVVGTLGWDMQQVILTFANLSTMRLDALGLSVEEVKNKQHELMQQGMSEAAAFKEAVIQAGEARLSVGGVSEAEQSFKQAEATVANFKNTLMLSVTTTLDQAGAFDALSKATADLMSFNSFATQLEDMRRSGELTEQQYRIVGDAVRRSGLAAGEAALQSVQLANAQARVRQEVAMVRVVTEATGISFVHLTQAQIDFAMAGAGVVTASATSTEALLREAAAADRAMLAYAGYATVQASGQRRQERRDENLAFVRHDPEFIAAGTLTRATMEYDELTGAVGRYTGGINQASLAEQALAEAHSRMASAFNAEVFADAADGLLGADGLVNVEAMNKAMYEQARAAGATAGQLALLGVATGALTEDQARAALKAAVLTEQARKLAMAVVAGQMGFGEAAAGMITFGAELDTQAAGQSLETLATAADGFAESVYEAELAVDNEAANLGLMASIDLINEFEGTHVANMVTTYSTTGGTSSPTGGGPMGGTSGAAGGNGTTTNSLEDDGKSRRYGRSATRNAGADLLPYGGGSVYPDRRSAEVYTNYHGGSTVNVTVTNYVDGRQVGRDNLDDITEDSIKRAMNELGLGRR